MASTATFDYNCTENLSQQERWILGFGQSVLKESRPRIDRIITRNDRAVPTLDVQRAHYFTQSMRATEGEPLNLRWAKALKTIAENISVHIDEDQLLAGRIGESGRGSIMYPEVEGNFYRSYLENIDKREVSPAKLLPQDRPAVDEIASYWEGRTYHENFNKALPAELHHVLFSDPEGRKQRFIVTESSSWRSSLQWVHDYDRVLKRGFFDIRREAEEALKALDPLSPIDFVEKRPFYESVIIVADAIMIWAQRHADKARSIANAETSTARREELLDIAAICERVPAYPARTFHEAVQSQWFVQLFSRLEQRTGTTISNGRMDQYFYPYYKNDVAAGKLDNLGALELLECLWCSMASYVEVYVTAQGSVSNEGYAHWEAVTIGGQTPAGEDATNELSHLILQSKRECPLHYPDLAARVHLRSPKRFLWDIAETIKHGSGYPKLLNDEEVVPLLIAKSASYAEAYDYAVSGCTEVRMPNRDTFTSGCPSINMASPVELTLYQGRMKIFGDTQLGVATPDPRTLTTWEAFWEAYLEQLTHLLKVSVATIKVITKLRAQYFAQPMGSALHDLCMKHAIDLHQEVIPEGIDQGLIDLKGYGTGVDALVAIKYHVYDKKTLTMEQMVRALEDDFVGHEAVQALLRSAPCYGNNDPYADSVGKAIERHCVEFTWKYMQELGIWIDIRYVPITAHVPFGKVTSAMPNGRNAWTPLADGSSPSHGVDVHGPTAVLLSNDATKNKDFKNRASRMLNLKFSPKSLTGDSGTRKLVALINAFIALKLWHVQFNVINRETLLAAQKDPQKYASLVVRIAGYSAYFVDLSPDLQNDLIARTSHESL